jgi:uncharacterized protein YndB with AHSA1/START domain
MAPEHRIDRAVMVIAASPERLYGAFIDAAALGQWPPPQGARGVIEAFEPRPGGVFRMTLVFESPGVSGKTTRNTDVVNGRFLELVPNERVALAITFVSDDPAFAGTMTMTWAFAPEDGGGTRVTITAVDVPPGILPEDHEQGMASSLANLAAHVEAR